MVTVHRARRVDQWDPPQGMCADRSLHIKRGWGHVSKQVTLYSGWGKGGWGHVSKQVTLYSGWGKGGWAQAGVSDTGDRVLCSA